MFGDLTRTPDIRLRTLSVRNVPRGGRGTDDLTLRVADRRNGDGDVDDAAVLSAARRFERQNWVVLRKPSDDRRLLSRLAGREEHGDRPPDGFLRHVSEEPFCTFVPALDAPVQVARDDRVIGRLDDGGKLQALLVGSLGLLPRAVGLHRRVLRDGLATLGDVREQQDGGKSWHVDRMPDLPLHQRRVNGATEREHREHGDFSARRYAHAHGGERDERAHPPRGVAVISDQQVRVVRHQKAPPGRE